MIDDDDDDDGAHTTLTAGTPLSSGRKFTPFMIYIVLAASILGVCITNR
jgi:hypothetical protein